MKKSHVEASLFTSIYLVALPLTLYLTVFGSESILTRRIWHSSLIKASAFRPSYIVKMIRMLNISWWWKMLFISSICNNYYSTDFIINAWKRKFYLRNERFKFGVYTISTYRTHSTARLFMCVDERVLFVIWNYFWQFRSLFQCHWHV